MVFIKGEHGPRYGTGIFFKDKHCEICGSVFHSLWKDKRTCSPKCSIELRHKKNSNITRICAVCHKEFQIPPAWLRKSNTRGIYCSVECRFLNKIKYTKKEKHDAVNRVNVAIKYHRIQRQPCIICGKIEADAHHHKGYSVEHQLDIIWLCDKHHTQEHERLRRYGLTQYL